MFVDWDGDGEVVVSFRKSYNRGDGDGTGDRKGKGINMSKRGMIPAPLRTIPRRRNSAAYRGKPLPALPSSNPCQPTSQSTSPSSISPPTSSLSLHSSSPSTPRTPTTPSITATYHPTTFSPTLNTQIPSYITGHDASAHLSYDYDGRIMHVQGPGSLHSESPVSAYYGVEVEKYRLGRGMEVKEVRMRDMGEKLDGKKKGVGKWVEKLMGRLEGMGLLGRLREDRWRERRGKG